MYRNWRNLIKPKALEFDQESSTPIYGKFIARPLERGFGITIGNALRRILLSSLQGAAIAKVKIEGVYHEFGTITGISEDVSDILLNLKQVRIRLHSENEDTMSLSVQGPMDVKAEHIETGVNITILNPEQHIATLNKDGKIDMEMTVQMNKGYVPAERNKSEEDPVGLIYLDSSHSPVTRVNYHVTNARVGRQTDYDRLTMEIWTDGSVLPADALGFAAKILKEQLQIFINFEEIAEPVVEEIRPEKPVFNENLNRKVDELELSVRSANCLQNAQIRYIGELCKKTEAEILRTKNFGRKSLNEIKEILSEMGLGLGMKLDTWEVPSEEEPEPVEDIE